MAHYMYRDARHTSRGVRSLIDCITHMSALLATPIFVEVPPWMQESRTP